jgi:protein ImuB
MPVADASSLLRCRADLQPYTPERDLALLEGLAMWASRRFSPTVALDPPDGLLLDITGCAAIFGGESHLIRQIRMACHTLGFATRVAIAPTYGAAWGLARFADARSCIVDALDLTTTLESLPVSALGISQEIRNGLEKLGIEKIRHLSALPRATIPARFGEGLLLRLDQALGQAMECIRPVRPQHPPVAERQFDGPTTRWEALEITLRSLLTSISAQLHARESGARGLRVELSRSDCPPTGFQLSLSHPTRDETHLWTLVRPHLERAHLGFGVEAIRVTASHLVRLPHEQRERWRDGEAASDTATALAATLLIDILSNRLGDCCVRRVELAESHVPERAGRLVAACIGGTQHRPPFILSDRPTLLLETPEPISAMALTPDGPVLRIRWRDEDLSIISCIGPERLGPEWWAGDLSGRDYFKAQDELGRWIWIRRDLAANAWSIHGLWV